MTPIKVFLWVWMTVGNPTCGGWIQLGHSETADLDLNFCNGAASAMPKDVGTFYICSPTEPNWRPIKETCQDPPK